VHDLGPLALIPFEARFSSLDPRVQNDKPLFFLGFCKSLPRRRHVASLHIILDHLRNSLALLGTAYTLTSCTVNL
jgi:hypothetical protein